MRNLGSSALIILATIVFCCWAIWPPQKTLRLGKDLAGGATLVYGVDVKPGETDVVPRVVEVIKQRIDPNGILEISVVPVGDDRIEITMPLPTEEVKALRARFEESLQAFAKTEVSVYEIDRVMALSADARAPQITVIAAGDKVRADALTLAATTFDKLREARARLNEAQAGVDSLRKLIDDHLAAGGAKDDPQLAQWEAALPLAQQAVAAEIAVAAPLEIEYEAQRAAAASGGVTAAEVRSALSLSDRKVRLLGDDKKVVELESPRARALSTIREQHKDEATNKALDASIAAWTKYEADRRTLDDPADLIRMMKGAGVLNFRITINPGEFSDEQEARNQLRIGGPAKYRSADARWFKINKIETWIKSAKDLETIKDPAKAAVFFGNMGYVVEAYRGEYFMLAWDRRGLRLTGDDGAWAVRQAFQGADSFGRPAIDFRMDPLGAAKLGALTDKNVGKQMAVILDDEIYTAPRLQSHISDSGQITGNFSPSEISYIVRVLSAGSLAAKLTTEPISQNTLGPELGADNLSKSFKTGLIALAMVAAFMIVYYFTSGVIAVIAMLFNSLLVIAMLAINQSAFSIPAIAGIILTFGQAVDSNVLIYERVREELQLGLDLRTSVRLGFSRALAPIVDGNVSNLIICVVLGFFGTEEIRGFAITLGIGVVTTLFSTLFVTRFLFSVLLDKFGWRHTSQLPMAVPMVQRMFSPHVDWMKHRWTLLGALTLFLVVSTWIAFSRGADLLGMEFRSGTAVTLTFRKSGPPDALVQEKMDRPEVQRRVKEIAADAPQGSPLKLLDEAQVITVNPDKNSVTSGTFTIKSLVTDPNIVQAALVTKFVDKLDVLQALRFEGWQLPPDRAPAYAITTADIGTVIEWPGMGGTAPEFQGGVAIVLKNITPAVSRQQIIDRLAAARQQPAHAEIARRSVAVRLLEGSESAATAVVVLVRDQDIHFEDQRTWETEVRAREWALVVGALTESETLAGVQSFSPAIARTFATQGIVCTLLSLLLLTIYVFVRFGTMRWAIAATVPLFADILGIVGLLGLAQILYMNPTTHDWAAWLGLRPFDLDLAQIAAVLTIVGYSLNDKIIILDRIRENKGKLPYATRKTINDSINQTLSRTVITAGAHMITTIALYLYGGESVRGFAYTFNLGVLLGTITSIVSTPLVWSRMAEPHEDDHGAGTPPSHI